MDGPAILFLHGGGQTRNSWRGAQTTLARRGFLAITVDARGHGESEWAPDKNYSIEVFAEDVRRIASQLGRRLTLVGASLGGHAAIVAISQKPGLSCSGLVLVDVVPRLNAAGRDHILEFMSSGRNGFASVDDAADAVSGYLPHRQRPSSLDGLQKNLRRRENGRFYWHWDPAFLNARLYAPEMIERMEKGLAASRAPILLLRGGRSEVVTQVEVDAFKKKVPRAEVLDITGAAHMIAGDRNDRFTEAVANFLEQRSTMQRKLAANDDASKISPARRRPRRS
jgi:pimeloyl-ACP methyl ester carboxylesterase